MITSYKIRSGFAKRLGILTKSFEFHFDNKMEVFIERAKLSLYDFEKSTCFAVILNERVLLHKRLYFNVLAKYS